MLRRGRKLDADDERARAIGVLDGSYQPSTPRPAVSVVLVRPATGSLELFLLERASTMAFLPERLVFPGGSVDPSDATAVDTPGLPRLADRLGVPIEQGGAIVNAAIRETHEETGVRLTLTDLMPWAHWVTPPVSPLRFDVWFFFAALPPGQQPQAVGTEARTAAWWTPAEVVARADSGAVQLATTQRELITELIGLPTLDDALATTRNLAPICLWPQLIDGDYYLVYPDHNGL